jgi:hypothetical protein
MKLENKSLLAAQIMAIVGLHNLSDKALGLVTARKEAKKPNPSREEAAEAKRLRKQARNIKNAQKQTQRNSNH